MAATPRQSARPPPPLSQAKERRIGEFSKRDTLMFNGHGTQVAQPYRGMDLQRFLCVAGDKRRGSTPDIRGGACHSAGHRLPWGLSVLHVVRGRLAPARS